MMVSASSYTFRTGYDYLSYLEQKSHFDRVEVAVDSGIKNLIASNEALAKAHIQTTNQLSLDIKNGFQGISISLDAINRSIDDLRSVCELGFAQIDLKLNDIDKSMQELVAIARTPDQTWAFEQYAIGMDAFRRNLFEEALDYVNRAIDGYGGRSGYRIEHRFYMLRGLIRIGNYRNTSEEIVDLGKATADFLLASKYAENDCPSDCARSFGLAGWASYCNGKIVESENYLRKSVKINSEDYQSHFVLSKVLFHLNKVPEASKHFAAAIKNDWKFALRAGSDDDFLKHRGDVEKAIQNYLSNLRDEMSNNVNEFDRLGLQTKEPILRRHNLAIDQPAKAHFEKIKTVLRSAPVSDLVDMREHVEANFGKLKLGLDAAKNQIRAKARSLREQRRSGYDPKHDGESYAVGFGIVAYILVVIGGFMEGPGTGVLMGIIGLPFAIIVGAIGKFIIGPLVWLIISSNDKGRRSSAAADLERDLARL